MEVKKVSMIDLAENILRNSAGPLTIKHIMDEVAKIKELEEGDYDNLIQLYLDITMSAKFVYVGEESWDLKERSPEFWEKDGFAFITDEELAEDDELGFEDFEIEVDDDIEEIDDLLEEDDEDEDEEKEVISKEELEEREYIDIEIPKSFDDEDDALDVDDDYDEDDYNEIMDDYEDMYD